MRKMRLLILFISIWCCQVCNAVTLHDLTFRLSYDKHVFPGRLLRGDIENISMMVQAEYFYKQQLFTGTIIDSSLEYIELVCDRGKIKSYQRNWDESNYYRYNVTDSDLYTWYAVDVQFENGNVVHRGEYFLDGAGVYRAVSNDAFGEGEYHVARYRIGHVKGKKSVYVEPFADGTHEIHYRNGFHSYQDYKNGEQDGTFRQTDSSGNVIDMISYSPDSGLYGEYLHIDYDLGTKTTGEYQRGYPSGVWTTINIDDGKVVEREWFHEHTGVADSVKGWHSNGGLSWVGYNYLVTDKSGALKKVYYSKYYNEEGLIGGADYYDGRDTMSVRYDILGRVHFARCGSGNNIQVKNWYYDSHNLMFERYYHPVTGFRDSVWREWDSSGVLVLEKYYDSGRYINTTVNQRLNVWFDQPANYTGAALIAINNAEAIAPHTWDTALVVPQLIMDSVCGKIARVHALLMKTDEPHKAVPVTVGLVGEYYNTVLYHLELSGIDSCLLDKYDHWRTGNARLDKFLDSLNAAWWSHPIETVSGKGRRKTKTYSLQITSIHNALNLFYINRRLNEIRPGSRISVHTEAAHADVLFFPVGTATANGTLPCTIVAVSGSNADASRRDYHAYIIYGDGDVEYATYGSRFLIYSHFGIPYPATH